MKREELPRSIGVWGGAAIMVGVIIGSGIFRVPTTIAQEMGSPLLILALWTGGGLLCLCGALTYAELGTMFPRSGGIYVFLREGFGSRVAFIFGWTYMLITQPLATAAIATVFSEHLSRLLQLEKLLGIDLDQRFVTCSAILALTAVNVAGMKRGAGMAVVLTGLKALALAMIVVLALVLMQGTAANFAATPAPKPFLFALAPVLAAIMWTYDGWSDTVAVAEEITEPQRRIPRIFVLGTVGTIVLYVAVNAVYIWLVPLAEMRQTPTVAPLAAERLVGQVGGTLVTVLILISTLGATHASLIVGSRVIFAQARDRLLFAFPSRVHPTYRTPAVALCVLGFLACLAAITLKRFEALMGGFIFTIWIFYGLSAAAVIVLRIRQPLAQRPYKCWGYPIVPVIFILAAAGMTVLSIHESARETLPWLGVLLAGVPAYSLWRRFANPGRAQR